MKGLAAPPACFRKFLMTSRPLSFVLLTIAAIVVFFPRQTSAQRLIPKRVVGMEYPELPARARITGNVDVICTVDVTGSVVETKPLGDPHPLLYLAARQNASKWKFTPGSDVTGSIDTVTISYTFAMEGKGSDRPHSQFVFGYPNRVTVSTEPYFINTASTKQLADPLSEFKTVVTVCSVLNDLKLYQGKQIAVVGRFTPTDEGTWLYENCEKRLTTGPNNAAQLNSKAVKIWSPSLWLHSSNTLPGQAPHIDSRDLKQGLADVRQKEALSTDETVWALVLGRLETRDRLQAWIQPDGVSVVGDGFGHLGASPAQLICRYEEIVLMTDREVREILKK